jgi:hypothetical protein
MMKRMQRRRRRRRRRKRGGEGGGGGVARDQIWCVTHIGNQLEALISQESPDAQGQ